MDVIASTDALLAIWVSSALWRVIAWAILSAALAMTLYAGLSPQQKLAALKENQRATRKLLLHHEGDFQELGILIRRDLMLSLRQISLMLLPFFISLAPLFILMIPLTDIYSYPLSGFGPSWMHGFTFWYVATLILASIILKSWLKIA